MNGSPTLLRTGWKPGCAARCTPRSSPDPGPSATRCGGHRCHRSRCRPHREQSCPPDQPHRARAVTVVDTGINLIERLDLGGGRRRFAGRCRAMVHRRRYRGVPHRPGCRGRRTARDPDSARMTHRGYSTRLRILSGNQRPDNHPSLTLNERMAPGRLYFGSCKRPQRSSKAANMMFAPDTADHRGSHDRHRTPCSPPPD